MQIETASRNLCSWTRPPEAMAQAPEATAPDSTAEARDSTPPDLWHDPRPWDPRQQPASLVATSADGRQTYGGVRWGWIEAPALKDWTAQFQDTTIDPGKLKDVHFYIEHFFPAGHAALVFEFEPGGVQGADGRSLDKLVYSIEARKKQGDSWTWQRGFKKTMGIVEQLMTFDDAKQWVTRHQGRTMETRRLPLTVDEKQAVLKTCLAEALKDRTGEYYHTTRNSCYSALQKVLNKALPEHAVSQMSPLTDGLLMRPEAFLTSSYTTVLKNMDLFSREKASFYLPDAQVHPAEHARELEKLQAPTLAHRLGSQAWMPTATRVAGALLGGALGLALSHELLAPAVLGYLGERSGALGGDLLESSALRTAANP